MMTYRHTEVGPDGPVVTVHRTEATAADAQGVTFAESVDGGPPQPAAHRWTELRDHASFPIAGTTWVDEPVTVPLGTFAARRYTVHDGAQTTDFWFAPELPGPPVKLEARAGDAVVFAMELLERAP
ncbi:MAG: hypothetical protein R3F59_34285 [Myxococcota bacterium]